MSRTVTVHSLRVFCLPDFEEPPCMGLRRPPSSAHRESEDDRNTYRITGLEDKVAAERLPPARAAEALVELACAGGAGDNVGVAVARPHRP